MYIHVILVYILFQFDILCGLIFVLSKFFSLFLSLSLSFSLSLSLSLSPSFSLLLSLSSILKIHLFSFPILIFFFPKKTSSLPELPYEMLKGGKLIATGGEAEITKVKKILSFFSLHFLSLSFFPIFFLFTHKK